MSWFTTSWFSSSAKSPSSSLSNSTSSNTSTSSNNTPVTSPSEEEAIIKISQLKLDDKPPQSSDNKSKDETNKTTDKTNEVDKIVKLDQQKLPTYTLEEVSEHDNEDSCWIVLYGNIYDVTPFLYIHPGGNEILLYYAGGKDIKEGEQEFEIARHSKSALKEMKDYLIGTLV